MQDILQHINSVEGVIGCAVFSQMGGVLAHDFPALIDDVSLKKAAALTLECAHGLQISESLDILDIRYADGRVVVKVFSGAMLFLLCAKNINLQILSITLNLATKKLEQKIPHSSSEVLPDAATSESADSRPVGDILLLSISHLANSQASTSFDSLGMVAISQSTAQYINDFYNSAFKRLTLVNAGTGTSGSFPVMIMKDMDQKYDGTIVVGPGIERKLKISEGDQVEVRI